MRCLLYGSLSLEKNDVTKYVIILIYYFSKRLTIKKINNDLLSENNDFVSHNYDFVSHHGRFVLKDQIEERGPN